MGALSGCVDNQGFGQQVGKEKVHTLRGHEVAAIHQLQHRGAGGWHVSNSLGWLQNDVVDGQVGTGRSRGWRKIKHSSHTMEQAMVLGIVIR